MRRRKRKKKQTANFIQGGGEHAELSETWPDNRRHAGGRFIDRRRLGNRIALCACGRRGRHPDGLRRTGGG
ncbi:hypothetical protein BMJ22_19350, partial [Sinorhizobium medicae]